MSIDLAKNLYAKMPDVFAKARKKFGRGLTLSEKVLVSHADDFDTQTWERQGDVGPAARSRGDAGRDSSDGHVAVHASQQGPAAVRAPFIATT